jgi:thioredoxin-related protein
MKNFLFIPVLILYCFFVGYGQTESIKIYDPAADAKHDITAALERAKSINKNVMLFIGGNWCPWCVKLNRLLTQDMQLDSLLHAGFEVVKVNYSKENKNLDLMLELDIPQRFGFPVIVILDHKGKRIHTQNTAYLESGESYDRKKIMEFFEDWGVKSLDPNNYKDYRK